MNNTDNAARTGEVAHTPTPWEVFPNFENNTCSIGHYGQSAPLVNHVCELPDLQSEDAAFIVRACNSHAAFEALATELAVWSGPSYSASRALRGFQEAARAALALTKGGQQ